MSSVLRTARAIGALPGVVSREAVSAALTAAVWPLGLGDRPGSGRTFGDRPPVLLVHGFGANKSNWLFLRRDLRAAGFARVEALNYNPLAADIPALADACVERARRLADATGHDAVHLVGHSLGGLVARYAVQLRGLDDLAASCVTVASPHLGVPRAIASRSPVPTVRQLAEGSRVLRRLSASSRPLPTRFVAYHSNVDLVVPGPRARIVEPALRAANVEIRGEGHLSILLSRRLSASLLDELTLAERRGVENAA
jgi:pimeloyl-ACP methyl ester carboxylesterase